MNEDMKIQALLAIIGRLYVNSDSQEIMIRQLNREIERLTVELGKEMRTEPLRVKNFGEDDGYP